MSIIRQIRQMSKAPPHNPFACGIDRDSSCAGCRPVFDGDGLAYPEHTDNSRRIKEYRDRELGHRVCTHLATELRLTERDVMGWLERSMRRIAEDVAVEAMAAIVEGGDV